MDFFAHQVGGLRRAMLSWYDASRRDLPWRRTKDPYRIWVSEIMLQQTRVAVVIDRYLQFLERFPSIQHLARARESAVLAEWSGLGYYRRARNLHAAAKTIVRDHSGNIPQSSGELQNLPGIGRYTASAIASIAWGEATAVVDGNVERVLVRLLNKPLTNREIWAAAQRLLDQGRPGDFNQAMMELGATICLPANPGCEACPIRRFCRTRGRGIRQGQKRRQQKRKAGYLLRQRQNEVLLVRRDRVHSLMPGMWELPEARAHSSDAELLFSVKHSITTSDFVVSVFGGSGKGRSAQGRWIRISRLNDMPLTGLARKILRHAGII